MPIDYRIYDLRNLFYLREVAMLWCDIDEVTPANKRCHASMICALAEAVGKGELKCADPILEAASSNPAPYNMTFSRKNLEQWALSKEQKPKFLFPEMRGGKNIRQKETAAIKAQEIDKACVQAVARTLWKLFPDMKAEAIANHNAIEIFCNGVHWEESTIKSWLREIDHRPKNKRAGRPRKTAAENIQPQYEDVGK